MTGKTIGYIALGIGALIGTVYLYNTFSFDKEKTVQDLIDKKLTFQTKPALMTWQDGFLKSWLKASNKGESTFVFENKRYATQGGAATK